MFNKIGLTVPLYFVFMLISPFTNTLARFVYEKDKKLRMAQTFSGMKSSAYIFAVCSTQFLASLPSLVLIVVLTIISHLFNIGKFKSSLIIIREHSSFHSTAFYICY
jgi:hypothetical protein